MRFLKINQFESRQLSIALSKGKYKKWMRKYLQPRDFYKISFIIQDEKILVKDLYKKFEFMIWEKIKIKVNYINYKSLTKVSYLLFLYNLLKFNKSHQELLKIISSSNEEKLNASLRKKRISILNKEKFSHLFKELNRENYPKKEIYLFAPVCPDYETEIDKYGNERYTFNGIGQGIGMVGKKFLEKLPDVISSFKEIDIDIKPIVLLGDFENNQSNIERLNITNQLFLNSLLSSKKIFEENYKIRAELFAEYFGGINSWNKRINTLKNELCFKNIKSLEKYYPNIDHQKIFLSRISLYRRWYGDKTLMTDLFINQIYEYILMGNLVSGFHRPSILLSSDHKAMAPYFACGYNSLPLISLNNFY